MKTRYTYHINKIELRGLKYIKFACNDPKLRVYGIIANYNRKVITTFTNGKYRLSLSTLMEHASR
jgi:hypothetical protein